MANPTISLLIPTSGNNPLLEDCLASIKKLNYPKRNIQTIIITNNDLNKAGKQFSFAASVNAAARKAKGKYLLITNDDITFDRDALTGWMQEAKQNPNAILGAKVTLKDTNKPAPAGYTFNLWTGFARPVYTGTTPTPCDWASGCGLMIERKIWKRLKGFDEAFSPGFFEDADLCFRAKLLGVVSLLSPKARVVHAQTETFNRNRPKKHEYWYRNKILFLRKHASQSKLITSLLLQYTLITPTRAFLLQDGRFKPALKGLSWNIKNR